MDVSIVGSDAISDAQMDAWLRLFDANADARFYQHPHWLLSTAKHLSPDKLRIALVSQGDDVILVLPTCTAAPNARPIHPEHDHLSLNDVLAHPSLEHDEHKLQDALHLALDSSADSWCQWQATNVPSNSLLIKALAQKDQRLNSSKTEGLTSTIYSEGERSKGRWLATHSRRSASFDCTSENCPPQGKLRRNLRRLNNKLTDQGTVRVETVIEPTELLTAYKTFLDVEASGWKSTGDTSSAIKAHESLRGFYESLLTPCKGLHPEINLLWCDDKCIAAQFGLRTGNCLSLLKIGYNEEYSNYSPGYLLLASVLANTTERNISTLSLVTSPPWSERWHPNTTPVWKLNYYNQSTIGFALHHMDKLKQAAKAKLKKVA